MTATVWVVLGLAVVVLTGVAVGVLVAGARQRSRRRADLARVPGLDLMLARALSNDADPETLPGDAARAIDPISLDTYLDDEATRDRVDALLDVVALLRAAEPRDEQEGQEQEPGIARRRLGILRQLAERYGRARPRPDGDRPVEGD